MITSIPDSHIEKWWEIVRSAPSATFFHTPIWSEIATHHVDSEPRPIFIEREGVSGVIPAIKKERTVSKAGISKEITSLQSTFAGCYGGLITDDSIGNSTKIYDDMKESAAVVSVVENPISDKPFPTSDVEEDFTQIIDLNDDIESIYQGFSDSRQRGITNAKEMGVNVRTTSKRDEWKEYYGAYEDSLERWDDPSSEYSWYFFEQIHELSLEYPEAINLWVAEVDEEIASGALIFSWNNHVDYWHGASYSEYFDYNPNDILHYEIMKWAVDRDYSWYDFNPSGGHDSVVSFKDRFGPERVPVRRWRYLDPKLRTIKGILNKFGF